MERKFVRKDEQIKLIMECRQSGLSDYQWCRQRDINPGTFYNWVSKLRKSGYTFPDSKSKSVGTAVVQEVVKLDVVEQEVLANESIQVAEHSLLIMDIVVQMEDGSIANVEVQKISYRFPG